MKNTANQEKTGFCRVPKVLELIPISKSTWWLWVRTGKAPKPVKLGARTTAWKRSEIDLLIEQLGGAEK